MAEGKLSNYILRNVATYVQNIRNLFGPGFPTTSLYTYVMMNFRYKLYYVCIPYVCTSYVFIHPTYLKNLQVKDIQVYNLQVNNLQVNNLQVNNLQVNMF